LDDLDRADELFRAALDARGGDGVDDALERAYIIRMLSLIAGERGNGDEADALLERSAALFRELGDARALFVVSHDRAIFTLRRRDHGRARALLDESVARARELDLDEDLASVLLDVGVLELRERRFAEATEPFVECLERGLKRGLRVHVAMSLRGL